MEMNEQPVCSPSLVALFPIPIYQFMRQLLTFSQPTSSLKTEAGSFFGSSPEHRAHAHSGHTVGARQPLNKYLGHLLPAIHVLRRPRAWQTWHCFSKCFTLDLCSSGWLSPGAHPGCLFAGRTWRNSCSSLCPGGDLLSADAGTCH